MLPRATESISSYKVLVNTNEEKKRDAGKETIREKKITKEGEKNGGKSQMITSVIKDYFFPIKTVNHFSP